MPCWKLSWSPARCFASLYFCFCFWGGGLAKTHRHQELTCRPMCLFCMIIMALTSWVTRQAWFHLFGTLQELYEHARVEFVFEVYQMVHCFNKRFCAYDQFSRERLDNSYPSKTTLRMFQQVQKESMLAEIARQTRDSRRRACRVWLSVIQCSKTRKPRSRYGSLHSSSRKHYHCHHKCVGNDTGWMIVAFTLISFPPSKPPPMQLIACTGELVLGSDTRHNV